MEVSKRKVTADQLVGQEALDAAISYAQDETGTLITGLTKNQLQAVRTSISRSIARGESSEQATARVKRIVGLDQRSALALDNFERSLRHRGLPDSRVRRLTRDYGRRLHDRRAKLVAEHEIARSIAEGRQRAWAQAQDEGTIGHAARRVRHAHNDEATCKVCLKLDGSKSKLDSPTTVPSHPGCRCWETLDPGKLLPAHKFHGNQHITIKKGDRPGHPFRGNQYKRVTSHAGTGWLKSTLSEMIDIPTDPIPAGFEEHDYTYKYFYGDMEWETFEQADIDERWYPAYNEWSTWEGNWTMRMASASLMDQHLPAALGDEYVKSGTRRILATGTSPSYPQGPNGELIEVTDPNLLPPTAEERREAQGAVESAVAGLERIYYSTGAPNTIYRGIEAEPGDEVLSLRPGDEFVMPLTAFTPDADTAKQFTSHGGGGKRVMFRLPPKTSAAPATDGYEAEYLIDGEWQRDVVEYVTAGRFRVTNISNETTVTVPVGTWDTDVLVIDLEQTGIFEPGFMGRWHEVSKATKPGIPVWVWQHFAGSFSDRFHRGSPVSKLDGSFRHKNLLISKRVWVPPHTRKGKPIGGYWRKGDPAGKLSDVTGYVRTKLNTSGGFTIHRMTGTEPTEGFSVALDPTKSLVIDPSTPDDVAEREILTWVAKNTRRRGPSFDDRQVYLGGWLDTDTGKTWLDVITVYPPDKKMKAIIAARAANQIAIWDLAKGEEISTGGTGMEKRQRPVMFLAQLDIDPSVFAREVLALRR